MSFSISSDVDTQKVATITMSGELDSLSSREFQSAIEHIAAESPTALVLRVADLRFMSSAGLRVLIFSKQKMGTSLPIYLVKPQEAIVDTLEKTGLQHSVNIVDEYPA